MKKILAVLIAVMLVAAMAVNVFAEDIVVYDNPDGQSWDDLVNPWDFFGTDGYWGRTSASGVLSMNWADIRPLMEQGGVTFTYVYGADNAGTPALNLTFNGDSVGNGVNAPFTTTELGDGKFEATVALDDMVAAWTDAGLTLDDAEAFLVQVFTSNFKLYSAKFTTGAAAPAAEEDGAEVAPEAEEEAPVAEPEAEAEAPAAETEAPAAEAETTADAPATGIALAVVPAVMALAALCVSKRK